VAQAFECIGNKLRAIQGIFAFQIELAIERFTQATASIIHHILDVGGGRIFYSENRNGACVEKFIQADFFYPGSASAVYDLAIACINGRMAPLAAYQSGSQLSQGEIAIINKKNISCFDQVSLEEREISRVGTFTLAIFSAHL
jgi:hypothetical protein